MKKKAKESAVGWMSIIEDAIPLDCIPPGLEVVLYRPPPSVDTSDA